MSPLPRTALASAALLALAACAGGSTTPDLAPPAGTSGASTAAPSATGSAMSGLTVGDQAFLTQAAYGGLAEVAMGRLAMEQAGSPSVRAIGQRMVGEHGRANQELVALARSKGMTPPTAPDMGRQATAAAMAELRGTNFDRQYLQQQMAEHAVAIALYDAQARGGSDPDVRAFASKWLPSLREHEREIRSLAAPTAGLAPGMTTPGMMPGMVPGLIR